jgi:hypothetical protein
MSYMRSDLVAVVVHPLDNASPVLINGTLAEVVSSDKESGVCSPRFELFHYSFGVDVWAIVVCNGDHTGVVADIYTRTAIGNASKLGTSVATSACSGRGLVRTKS